MDNPRVREEVKKIMRFWLDMGVDGFREDVITFISKDEGLPSSPYWFPIGTGIEQLVAAIGLTGGAAGMVVILLDVLVMFLLCVLTTAVGISFVHAVTARLKIEQIFKYYWTVVSGLALISLVLSWYGF